MIGDNMSDTGNIGAPEMREVEFSMLRESLRRGWGDMKRAPGFGAIFASAYVLVGLIFAGVTYVTGQSYWLIFAAVGFPLIGPFASVGLYEVSRQLEQGGDLDIAKIFGVVAQQSKRQLPSLCVIIIMIFLFWFFLAHMIFALFMGLSTMTNVSSSFEVYLTSNGLMMFLVGTIVGALIALLLFMITVMSLPLLLDREIDFVTAMIVSFQTVLHNPAPMLAWGFIVAVITFIALIPGFLGLFFALPLLGHASWHLYRLIAITNE